MPLAAVPGIGVLIPGPLFGNCSVDSLGNRECKVSFLVMTHPTDGPLVALDAPGLPLPGDPWAWESDGLDFSMVCQVATDVQRHTAYKDNEPIECWKITYTYSSDACKEIASGDPLFQPNKISGSSVKYTEEATVDRFGVPIQNSAWQQIRGPRVEFDANRPQIIVEQNVSELEKALLAKLIDNVNDEPMWGFPKRCVKFSEYSWREECHGIDKYYVRRLTFDVFVKVKPNTVETDKDHLESGFDRRIPDEGSKVLYGKWNRQGKWELVDWLDEDGFPVSPDWSNPTHFMRAIDKRGNPTTLLLDGRGEPYDPDFKDTVKKWWCLAIEDGSSSLSYATCTEVKKSVDESEDDISVYGPYDDEETASEACFGTGQLEGVRPFNLSFCPTSKQGVFFIEYYEQADLFQLNVPTEFGTNVVLP